MQPGEGPVGGRRNDAKGTFRRNSVAGTGVIASLATALAILPSHSQPPSIARTRPADLLHMLDPNRPEGTRILQIRRESGDSAALKELAAHFRTKSDSGWPTLQPDACPPDPEADSALRGLHRAIGMWSPSGADGIDWHRDPTGVNGIPKNVEWLYALNRHQWWPSLACRTARSGNRLGEYGEVLVKEINSWLEQCPPPSTRSNGRGSSWRTIEAGIRMIRSWPETFSWVRRSEAIDDSTILKMLASMVDQAEYLVRFKTDHNWLALEMDGLHAVGTLLPEFSRSKKWRKIAISSLDSALGDQFLPDGVHEELSPSYHSLTLWCARDIIQRSRSTGRSEEVSRGFVENLERGYDALAGIWAPDGEYPRWNDSHDMDIRKVLLQGLELFPRHGDWRWIATGGKHGSQPDYRSRIYPWAGWCLFRTSWNTDANLLAFDRGPTGRSHEHQDMLSISAWSHGRMLLFDDGGGPYEESEFRKYSLSTQSHSAVLVDGKGQNRPPQKPDVPDSANRSLGGTREWASGTYRNGWGIRRDTLAFHTRTVVSVSDLWIVSDSIVTRDGADHSAQASWQLASTRVRCDSFACVTADSGIPNLAIVPIGETRPEIQTMIAQKNPLIMGWHNRVEGRTPATTLLHSFPEAGSIQSTTALIPLDRGVKLQTMSIASNPRRVRIRLSDGRNLVFERNPQLKGGWDVLAQNDVDSSGKGP